MGDGWGMACLLPNVPNLKAEADGRRAKTCFFVDYQTMCSIDGSEDSSFGGSGTGDAY